MARFLHYLISGKLYTVARVVGHGVIAPLLNRPSLADTKRTAMKSEEWKDVTIFLFFRSHCMKKHYFWGGGTLFSSEYYPGEHDSL